MQFIGIPDLSDIQRRSYPAFASGPRQGGLKIAGKICIVALTEEEHRALLEITPINLEDRGLILARDLEA
jgi:hypothetical protein